MRYIPFIFAAIFLTACAACPPPIELPEQPTAPVLSLSLEEHMVEEAIKSDPNAMYLLATSGCCGQKFEDIFRWLCSAARQGHTRAQFDVGRIYAGVYPMTNSVPPDYTMALMWFETAQRSGFHSPGVLHNHRHAAIGHLSEPMIDAAIAMVHKASSPHDIPCATYKTRKHHMEENP